MAILVQCQSCRTRCSIKKKVCKCGFSIQKAASKIYWVDYYEGGKRVRELVGRSKTAAANRLREVQTAIAEGRYVKKSKNASVTLGTLENWYLDLDEVKELDSYPRIRVLISHTVRILGEKTKVSDLTIAKVRAYRKTRAAEYCIPYPDRHPTLTTINREVSALKTMLNKAVGEILDNNPIIHAKLLKENNIRERVLTEDEFERLYDCAPDHLKPILLMAFYEPMRKGEILKLEWSEVDCSKSMWFIRLAAYRTKGKKSAKVLPFHPRVQQAITSLPSRNQGGRVFLYEGKPVNSVKTSFKSALRRAGIVDFHFHDFRRCAVTNLRKAGNDYTTIMKISGHKTMSMFLRYNLVNEEDVAGLKWKGLDNEGHSISSSLENMGLNPDEVFKSLLQERRANTRVGS